MKDFKGGMGRAKSSLDRPWNPGTTKGRFDSIVMGPGWTVSLLFDNPGLGHVLIAHLMKQTLYKIIFQKLESFCDDKIEKDLSEFVKSEGLPFIQKKIDPNRFNNEILDINYYDFDTF